MSMSEPFARQATCIAIKGRAVLIEGASKSGKSSLALSLIDRGADLVGDDGVLLHASAGRLLAHPHPNTRGLIEVRNLGILRFPCLDEAPVALLIRLSDDAPRFIEAAARVEVGGIALPSIHIWPHAGPLAIKVELALLHYGLSA